MARPWASGDGERHGEESKKAVEVEAHRECSELAQSDWSEAGMNGSSNRERFWKKKSLVNAKTVHEIKDACYYQKGSFKVKALSLVIAPVSEAVY